MLDTHNTDGGAIMYCTQHDQGGLVPGPNQCELSGEKLSQHFCGVEFCSNEWTQHGTYTILNDNILLDLEGKTDDWYDDLAGGWLIRYFYESVYGNNRN